MIFHITRVECANFSLGISFCNFCTAGLKLSVREQFIPGKGDFLYGAAKLFALNPTGQLVLYHLKLLFRETTGKAYKQRWTIVLGL